MTFDAIIKILLLILTLIEEEIMKLTYKHN